MIRIDAMWLAAEPIDMRAGAERLLARVVQVFGVAQAHHGYLFANARGTRIKLLVHDGFGLACTARRAKPGATPAIRAPASAPRPGTAYAGISRCAQASASCWTRPAWSTT